MSEDKKIPDMKNYDQMGEFWDTHSLADYWQQTEPAEFTVSGDLRSRYFVPLDSDLLTRLNRIAHQRGVSTESLVNLFLEQRINEIAQSR